MRFHSKSQSVHEAWVRFFTATHSDQDPSFAKQISREKQARMGQIDSKKNKSFTVPGLRSRQYP